MRPVLRGFAYFLACASLGVAAFAQEPEQENAKPEGASHGPGYGVEFAVSDDSLWFGYRSSLERAGGYYSLSFLANTDDDYTVQGKLMRYGQPSAETPLGLGVGLGLLGSLVDDPDSDVVAITLTGAIDYTFDLTYATRLAFEGSYAPDVATFADGEGVTDLLGRVELDLSKGATAFVGYRLFELDLEDEADHELDSSVHAGVRIGL